MSRVCVTIHDGDDHVIKLYANNFDEAMAQLQHAADKLIQALLNHQGSLKKALTLLEVSGGQADLKSSDDPTVGAGTE